jgi:phosphopantothenoylcysteine decarboxylase/phosphopantothenate--cysteine ligase
VFSKENDYSTEHISISDWGDIFVVTPATVNVIGKFASGIADDALSTTFASFNKPIFIAPAMNEKMYNHPVFQRNFSYLRSIGVNVIDAETGELACGTIGKGRMAEPETIFNFVSEYVEKKNSLKGKKILVTAGPTYEKIDPVRYIGNHSSGKMGYSLSKECACRGAEVTLISGPVNLATPDNSIKRIDVESAEEMYNAVISNFESFDAVISCAAVSDFTPEKVYETKQKRGTDDFVLSLKPTKDIASAIGKMKKNGQVFIGFALETDNEHVNAQKKLVQKNLDFIVLNSLKDKGTCFKSDNNKITIIEQNGIETKYELKSKAEVASDIVDKLENYF